MMNFEERNCRRYPGYKGGTVFRVEHPDYETLYIAAPSGVAAIIVAADDWGSVWSDPVFFNRCDTRNLGVLTSAVMRNG